MSNVRVVLNRSAVADLLKSAEVVALIGEKCEAIAHAAQNAAGPDAEFGHDVITGARRAHGMVWTENVPAMLSEAHHRTLTASLDAGRG